MNWKKLAGYWHYRPRVLTLVALLFTAGLLVLANLTDQYDERQRKPDEVGTWLDGGASAYFVFDPGGGNWADATANIGNLSNGWPLLWNQYIVGGGYARGVIGWRYSAVRLGVNIALWVLMLAVPTVVCQWWLLNRRPHFRWSLRGMLTAVGLIALCLGWFVWARDRADEQDALINEIEKQGGIVWLRRWGPTWLDLIGADRYRRAVATVNLRFSTLPNDEEPDRPTGIKTIERLAHAPELEYLFLESFELSPDAARALGDLRRLRMLSLGVSFIHSGGVEALGDALRRMPRLQVLSIELLPQYDCHNTNIGERCLSAACQAANLEALQLSNMTVHAASLARLGTLTRLKLLCLARLAGASENSESTPLLSELPALAQLEEVLLNGTGLRSGYAPEEIRDEDLPYLARLPRLKSLLLVNTKVTAAGLRGLAAAPALEQLSLCQHPKVSPAIVESLRGLRQLKKLQIDAEWQVSEKSNTTFQVVPQVEAGELEATMRALQSLREARPGIAIIDSKLAPYWHYREFAPRALDTRERSLTQDARQLVREWKAKGSPNPPGRGIW